MKKFKKFIEIQIKRNPTNNLPHLSPPEQLAVTNYNSKVVDWWCPPVCTTDCHV